MMLPSQPLFPNAACRALRLLSTLSLSLLLLLLVVVDHRTAASFVIPSHSAAYPGIRRARAGILPTAREAPAGNAGNDRTENPRSDSVRSNNGSLDSLLSPSESCDVRRMSGTDLAYIGDVVFELFVRSRTVWPSRRTSAMQDIVVETVRAENQARLVDLLRNEFPLTDRERQVITRGRNSVTKSRNRRNPAAYQNSTAFEAFIGFLYITDKERLARVLQWLDPVLSTSKDT